MKDSFQTRSSLQVGRETYTIFRLSILEKTGLTKLADLPFSIRILLENLLRNEDGQSVFKEDVEALARWSPSRKSEKEIAFTPGRVLLQDFTGVPVIVDLAAMRDAMKNLGKDPRKINPLLPVHLVIDHSVQVDVFGSPGAFLENTRLEVRRNLERYQFLRWGQSTFQNFHVVPPGTGIVHQVNLECLASIVMTKPLAPMRSSHRRKKGEKEEILLYPDALIGTDSHTTMINGLGILGWGVGGIEAEAAMLGQPVSMTIPEVVGFKLYGLLREGATATDVVLTITQMLRKKGVVEKFVEFFGPGLDSLSLPDRATIANMAPEYGATIGFFPVDQETLDYLRFTGREHWVSLAEIYCKAQGLFRDQTTPDPQFSETLELDLSTVEPSLAGPRRPHDRVSLKEARHSFRQALLEMAKERTPQADSSRMKHWLKEGGSVQSEDLTAAVKTEREAYELRHGSVVIAAITSCTNTSNPQVMMGAGLLAQKALRCGLTVKPWVKTSLAPGSKVVMEYLKKAGLIDALEKLRFHLVGFGCTTCIGNSGPLPEPVAQIVRDHDLAVVAVLSGNRNFEGRINPLVRASYLASPPLVVAYAIAGTIDIDLSEDPLGQDSQGKPVYLKDIWPSDKEIQEAMRSVTSKMFQEEYSHVFEGDEDWRSMKVPKGDTFPWDPQSTYVKHPPYFEDVSTQPLPLKDIEKARVLVMVGDSVTTDHISPAGSIQKDSPAGKYLMEHGIEPKDFNSYGARRGNHEVMIRGTFANVRLKNLLVPATEGGWTRHLPDGEKMTVYDAAIKYQKEGVPLLVLAGKEYGSGSSRDWAAKGPALLGIRAVIAESFERIHRSNLIGMGVLPLEFEKGQGCQSLGLTGEEEYSIQGISKDLAPRKKLTVSAKSVAGEKKFNVLMRIDTPVELSYYQHGGILPYVLRQLL